MSQLFQELILARLLATLTFLLVAVQVYAGQQVDIYRAEALVTSQQASERATAARGGLREVMIRVSGDRAAADHPTIASAISQAQNYLHEFSYASTDKRIESDSGSKPATLLIMKFSPVGIEQLLRDAGLPLWPANRPKLMVWMISEDNQGAQHRVPDEPALQAIYAQAAVRGLPLLFPLQDFEDTIALPSELLNELDEESIRGASERYKPDAILAGKLTQSPDGQWQSSWLLIQNNDVQPVDGSGADLAAQISSAIDYSADQFARQYAIVPRAGNTDPDVVVLRINDVADFADFKQVQRYFEGMAMVKHFELLQAEGNRLTVQLQIEGDLTLLSSTLDLGKKLFPVASVSIETPFMAVASEPGDLSTGQAAAPSATIIGSGSRDNPLTYRWAD